MIVSGSISSKTNQRVNQIIEILLGGNGKIDMVFEVKPQRSVYSD